MSFITPCDKYGPLFITIAVYLEFKNFVKIALLESNKTLFSNKYKVSVLNKAEIELKTNTEMYKTTKIKTKLLPISTVSKKIIKEKAVAIFMSFNKNQCLNTGKLLFYNS
jgi:hypothetical protein